MSQSRDAALERANAELYRLAGVDAPRRKRGRAKAPPRAKAPRAKKAKPPCKYGPRGADGYCPKKPRSEVSVRQLRSGSAATEQAIKVLRNPKASGAQKREALSTAATAIAWEGGKGAARGVRTEVRKATRTAAGRAALRKLKGAAGTAVLAVGKKALPVAGIYGAVKVGGKLLTANARRAAKKWAKEELARTEKKTGRLPANQRAALLQQYEAWKLKQPVYTPTIK